MGYRGRGYVCRYPQAARGRAREGVGRYLVPQRERPLATVTTISNLATVQ